MRRTKGAKVNNFSAKAARFLGSSAGDLRLGDFIGGQSWRREGDLRRTFSRLFSIG
jgi:hypothetical protein